MVGWSPGCYIPSFVEIGPPVPEKKILKVFTIYGRGGQLGHVTSIMSKDFILLYLKAFIQNSVQIGTVVSEKLQFDFLYVHDLRPRSRNDLDLQYSHIFKYSIRCQLLLPFRSLAAIGFKYPLFSIFPREKHKWPNLYVHDLGLGSRNDLDLQYSHSFI